MVPRPGVERKRFGRRAGARGKPGNGMRQATDWDRTPERLSSQNRHSSVLGTEQGADILLERT